VTVLRTTRNIDKNIELSPHEMIAASAFLSRPSQAMIDMAKEHCDNLNNSHLLWDNMSDATASIHIRQRTPPNSLDWVRKNSRYFTPSNVMAIVKKVYSYNGIKNFIIASDDSQLTYAAVKEAQSHSNEFHLYSTSLTMQHAALGDNDSSFKFKVTQWHFQCN
jgi:hypothetical protein